MVGPAANLVLPRPNMNAEHYSQQLQALERVVSDLASRCAAAAPELAGQAQQVIAAFRQTLHEMHDHERELRRKAERVARADHRRNEFIALLSHELRNPLAAITNATHVLDRIGAQTTRAVNLRTMIVRQAQHLRRMVDDLLDVANLSRGKVRLRKKTVELNALVHRAVEAVKPLIEERGHRFDLALPPEPVWLRADPARLEHALVNLLNNASKYTEPGGRVWLTVQPSGDRATVKVKDSGVGIRPELLPHVFDRPTALEEDQSRLQAGLGIGLMLVRRLVELHGGSVAAHSDGEGQGSEFTITLPILSSEAARKTPVSQAVDRPVGRLRVLLVEDDKDAARSLAMLLRLKGCEVSVARDGRSAIAAAQAEPPDVALLDIGLPDMDGYQVARELRALPGLERTRLVAVTGFGQEEDRRRSREAGFEHHLVKPVEPEALQELLLHTPGAV